MIIPVNIELSTWAASLIVDFPHDNVPLLYNSDEWKPWGNLLVEGATFAKNGSPETANYEDWQDWAMAVFNTMANY